MVYNTNVIGTLNILEKEILNSLFYYFCVYANHTPFRTWNALVELEDVLC